MMRLTLLALVTMNAMGNGGSGERMYVQNNWQFITLDPSSGAVLDVKLLNPLIANRGLIYHEGHLFFLDQNVLIQRDQLFALHPATGRATVVGPTGYSMNQPGGFAKDPSTGQFYVTFAHRIFQMDSETGKISFIAQLATQEPLLKFAIDSGGRAFGISDPSALSPRNRLFRVDLQTGKLAEIGPLDVGLGIFRAIAFDGSDQLWGLYTHFSNPFQHTLYTIDIENLKVTEAFPLPQGALGIAFGPAPRVWSYCTAKVNSAGCAPGIDWSGHPSASAHFGFEVTCSDVRNDSSGMLMVGTGGQALVPYQGGTLCLAPPWVPTPPVHSGGAPPPTADCSGSWTLDLNAFLYANLPLPAGTVLDCQWWGRDPGLAPPDSAQLSDALQVALMP